MIMNILFASSVRIYLDLGDKPGNWERGREGVASNFEDIWNSKGHLSALSAKHTHFCQQIFTTFFSTDTNACNQKYCLTSQINNSVFGHITCNSQLPYHYIFNISPIEYKIQLISAEQIKRKNVIKVTTRRLLFCCTQKDRMCILKIHFWHMTFPTHGTNNNKKFNVHKICQQHILGNKYEIRFGGATRILSFKVFLRI